MWDLLGSFKACKGGDRSYVADKSVTFSCICFMFIKIKFICCNYYMIFIIKSINMCSDLVNYDNIIMQKIISH